MTKTAPVPFTILTGWLGAGKTTALNRLLARAGGRRVAVLVNELGRIGIDGGLIGEAGGDLLELAGGCVCCKLDVKNDLWDGIADVVARSRPDQIVLETTGIAEPPALLEGLGRLEELVVPAGVVAVVDAETADEVLARREEAAIQIRCADRVILSKLDRAGPDRLRRAHELLRQLNPAAERASFPASAIGDRALADYVLAARTLLPPAVATGHRHSQLAAACFADPAPLDRELLLAAVAELRPRLVRVKGFAHLAGDPPRRAALELAGSALSLAAGEPWRAGEAARSELVFIGEAIDDAELARRLWACRVSPG
jgi:G3E family GTPase